MPNPLTQLGLRLDPMPDDDKEDMARLTQQLRQDLLELEVDSVDLLRSSAAPAGTKGDPVTLGALAVSLAPIALTALFNMLQSWLTRHERASVTVKTPDGDIMVTGSPSQEQRQVIDDFINRHKP